MKKLISLCIVLSVISGYVSAFGNEMALREEITYSVETLAERIYNKRSIECMPVDITSVANMAFADDVAGDGKGGWSDQGRVNDMSGFTTYGRQIYANVPFDIIDPAENDNKSCVVLRGRKNEAFPLNRDIPVNDTAHGIYILHSSAWNGDNQKVAEYSFVYEDGSSAYFDIKDNVHIFNFWGQSESTYSKLVWTGPNNSTPTVSFTMFALNNPHPEKTIKYFRVESTGTSSYICIIGATLAKEPIIFPKSKDAVDNGIMKAGADSWTHYNVPDAANIVGTALDASIYLDKPAGKHGVLKSAGESFVFEDGTKAKFWGTNLVGDVCFPSRSDADKLAATIAVSGYNLVRFTDIDNGELTDDKLDKMSYFMKALKERGVYVYISLAAKFDADENHSSIGIVFDDEVLKAKSEFVRKLFNYNDSYTNMKIADNNQIVMVDMADQTSMYDYVGGHVCFNPTEKENEQLVKKFNDFLKNKYKTTAKLKTKWKSLGDDEKLESSTIRLNAFWKQGEFDTQRKSDIIEFLTLLQTEHYNEIKNVLTSCGYKGLITGFANAWDNTYIFNSLSNSKTDFIPINAMASWGYKRMNPWHFHTKLTEDMFYMDSDATVASDGRDGKSLINLFENRINGKPYVVTEYGAPVLNKLYEDNAILMAAVSAQQGWTPIRYCFADNEINTENLHYMYTTIANPVSRGMAHGAASLYYTMDELKNSVVYNLNIKAAEANNTANLKLKNYMQAKSSTILSTKKTSEPKAVLDEYEVKNDNILWDLIDGSLLVDTGKVIAFAGDLNQKETIGCLEFDVYSTELVMTLNSLDGKDIKDSDRMLLSVANSATDAGTEYFNRYILQKPGIEGIRYQSVSGEFLLKTTGDYNIFALDAEGVRVEKIPSRKTSEGYTYFIIDGSQVNAINFEIIRSDESAQ